MTKAKTPKPRTAKTIAKVDAPRPLAEAESAAIHALTERRKAAIAPKMKLAFADKSEDDQPVRSVSIDIEGMDKDTRWRLLEASLGVTDFEGTQLLVSHLAALSTSGKDAAREQKVLNGNLGLVQSIAPQDAIEAMLAMQMVAIHGATLQLACEIRNSTSVDRREQLERSMNRCARTFTAQVEGLKRYRSKGEQKVTVEHVTVNEGGQAIVGAVGGCGK